MLGQNKTHTHCEIDVPSTAIEVEDRLREIARPRWGYKPRYVGTVSTSSFKLTYIKLVPAVGISPVLEGSFEQQGSITKVRFVIRPDRTRAIAGSIFVIAFSLSTMVLLMSTVEGSLMSIDGLIVFAITLAVSALLFLVTMFLRWLGMVFYRRWSAQVEDVFISRVMGRE